MRHPVGNLPYVGRWSCCGRLAKIYKGGPVLNKGGGFAIVGWVVALREPAGTGLKLHTVILRGQGRKVKYSVVQPPNNSQRISCSVAHGSTPQRTAITPPRPRRGI
jgi:hypothetical protein